MKILQLYETILIYVHPKMVAMETMIIYPDSIFRYIGELQFMIFNIISQNISNISHNLFIFVC